ncbi:uncharacterized protein LOC121070080 [Cygnus olor]|uniref:uncharacterized protein LOC121070080 n=1 Tax=Cygnus olor TaxID=8869 RepID=UPI001ADE6EF2|nr:uncharacterized protein LOC121070080 [Cygnus olor]XP_040412639.1 uncharacterized protein LOC121070080 [Cygnus olor]
MLQTPPRPAAMITAVFNSASAPNLGPGSQTLCNSWSQEPSCPHFTAQTFCNTRGCCVLLPEQPWVLELAAEHTRTSACTLGGAGQGEGPSVSAAAELPEGAGSYPGSSGTSTCKLWSVCELLLLPHRSISPEHRWAFTSPWAVELQLLGRISSINNSGASGQSGSALLGISPSGSVSPAPGRITGSGLGSVLGRWGSPSSAEDEAGRWPPVPSCCRSRQSDSRPARPPRCGSPAQPLLCQPSGCPGRTNATRRRASPPPGAGTNDPPTALAAQQKCASFAKRARVQEVRNNCIPQALQKGLRRKEPWPLCVAASTAENS